MNFNIPKPRWLYVKGVLIGLGVLFIGLIGLYGTYVMWFEVGSWGYLVGLLLAAAGLILLSLGMMDISSNTRSLISDMIFDWQEDDKNE